MSTNLFTRRVGKPGLAMTTWVVLLASVLAGAAARADDSPAPAKPAAPAPAGQAGATAEAVPAQAVSPKPAAGEPPPASSLPAVPPPPAPPPTAAASPAMTTAPAATTNDVTLNLIHLLVQQHVITARQADALFKQAQQQAATQAAQRGGGTEAPAAPHTVKLAEPIPMPVAEVHEAPIPGRAVHVTYVPEVVREQLKQQIKDELLADSKKPGGSWGGVPDWVRRLRITGDIRFRFERQFWDGSNDPTVLDFNSINSGSPYDVNPGTNSVLPPLLNTTENRSRLRLRGRIGFVSDVSDDLSVGIRFTTGTSGEDSGATPVSTNETLGGEGSGYFNRLAVSFDRFYMDYHPVDWLKLRAGRFANPWFATDLVWYSDLNFDGFVAEFVHELGSSLRPFFTIGAFPIENTALSFPSNDQTKEPSRDRWLFAAQFGMGWLLDKQDLLKVGVAYYDFAKIAGVESAPCIASSASFSCNTDDTRPGFSQKGNTMFEIRDAVSDPTSTTPSAEFQYFGLASPFRVLDVNARFDMSRYDPVHIIFDAEGAINLGFNRNAVSALAPVNNYICLNSACTQRQSNGGNLAFIGQLTVGHPEIRERWDWNVITAYKYLESDAVVDAFTDPDFHGGGTNARGYIIGGSLGIAHNLWLTTRFLSATEVSGPPIAVDILQLDINARF